MSCKPIIFSTPMVQAILAGKKTQTRRVIKPQPYCPYVGTDHWYDNPRGSDTLGPVRRIPYAPGDVLWVRETWSPVHVLPKRYLYKADAENGGEGDGLPIRWRPSIHMPREAARLFLRVKDVRVERVQDITAEDALKEGCTGIPCDQCAGGYFRGCTDCMNSGWQEPPQLEFSQRWDARNAKHGYGWDSNPWVWVYTFERITKEEAEHGH